jgi:hypothetical protein
MNNEDKNLITCLIVGISLILIPIIAVYQAWVLTILWGWFIVSTFHLPELSIPAAIGLTLIIGMFKTYKTSKEKVELSDAIAALLVPLIILFFGWLVHLFM